MTVMETWTEWMTDADPYKWMDNRFFGGYKSISIPKRPAADKHKRMEALKKLQAQQDALAGIFSELELGGSC